LFYLKLITLVSRRIPESFVQIRLYLPEISPILELGVGQPPEGVTYFSFFLSNNNYRSE